MLFPLFALVLPHAEAANTPKIKNIRIREITTDYQRTCCRVRVISISGGTDTRYEGRVTSDSGTEAVTFEESDAWLHGSADLKAAPGPTARMSLTLYDAGSAPLATFSYDGAWSAVCDTKAGCADIEVLAGELFPATTGGYSLAFDLAGADTYAVAYAKVAIDDAKVTTCDKSGCTSTGGASTWAEVFWDDIGAVWEADLTTPPEGLVDVEVTGYDSRGKPFPKTQVKISGTVHFVDDWQGESMLASDDDPLTSVAYISDQLHAGGTQPAMTVISEGWTAGSALPASAEVALTNGSTLTFPANSYQFTMRKRPEVLFQAWDAEVQDYLSAVGGNPLFNITINGGNLYIDDYSDLTLDDLALPVCVQGTCVQLIEEGTGAYALSVSAYSASGATVPGDVKVGVALVTKEGKAYLNETTAIDFDSAVTVVFANAMGLREDPIGLDVVGKVSLLGAAEKNGKTKTLSKGTFYGQFSRDDGGNLRLAGADKNSVSARGDILIGGEPIGFELTKDENGDGVISAPPVIVLKNGTGTRNTSCNTSQTQQAQLL